jgi:hypothetical protein
MYTIWKKKLNSLFSSLLYHVWKARFIAHRLEEVMVLGKLDRECALLWVDSIVM